jgi:hypothetical protein
MYNSEMKKDPETDAGPVTPPTAMPKICHPNLSDLPSAIPKVIIRAIAGPVLFLSLGCFSALAYTSSGTTYTTNGSAADVQAAVSIAPAGATVIIPNGNYTWSQQVNVSQYLIIRAATVTPSANVGGPPTTSPPVVTTTPAVSITWNGTASSGNAPALNINDNSAGNTQIAGINFLGPLGINGCYISTASAGGLPIIIQDCAFNIDDNSNSQSAAIYWGTKGGLVYNCWFNGGSVGRGGGVFKIVINGSVSPWYNPSTLGTLDSSGNTNLYVEQCQFDYLYNQGVDCDDCTRIVLRYSIINNCNFLTHGITSNWGGRQVEFYKDSWQYFKSGGTYVGTCPAPPPAFPNVNRYFWMRAGTARIWGNTVQSIWSSNYYATRASWSFITEPLTRQGTGNGGVCETESEYPGTRWPGTGSTGSQPGQSGSTNQSGVVVSPSFVDPVYIWNNTDAPASSSGAPSGANSYWGTTDQTGYGCNPPGSGNQTSDVFQLGRDLIMSAPSSYTPYTYPHPLQAVAGGAAPSPTPLAPQDLKMTSS